MNIQLSQAEVNQVATEGNVIVLTFPKKKGRTVRGQNYDRIADSLQEFSEQQTGLSELAKKKRCLILNYSWM